MFTPYDKGSSVEIQGLVCQIPPAGYVFNVLTDQLEKREIISRSKKKSEQYWERQEAPEWYVKRAKKAKAEGYVDPQCAQYEAQEWDRRLNGVWFMNNGEATYLTGAHYMYVNHFKIDIGYPSFYIPDMEYFYFQQYCVEDPLCLGMNEVTKRRSGKTYRAGLWAMEYASRMSDSNAGIQSKTDTDAKKFFSKAVVQPFKNLPDFFKPEYDLSQGVTPKKELRFQTTNRRGKNAKEALDVEDLNSVIDYQSSELMAYDGQKLHRAVADEAGKTTSCSIYDRHDVVRYCLLDNQGKVIGKILYTTTVEKLETERTSVSDAFKQLWEDSDQTNRAENGMTASGLYRFFMSADRLRNFDIYGFPDVERNIQEILADREAVKHNPRALAARIRKEPRTIEEAFRVDGDKCMYNSAKLQDQLDYLQWNEDVTERGNFVWAGGVRDSKVVWEKNRDGRWLILRGFNLKPEDQNQVEKIGSSFRPMNGWRFASGVDPFDHDVTEDRFKRSKAASLVKQKINVFDGEEKFNNTYVCRYLARPATAALMYEDILKQCFYFGTPILVENNKPGIMRYFNERGYSRFLVHMKGYKDTGVPSTPGNKQVASELVEGEIENNCSSIPFKELIEDLLVFDIGDTRKYDLAMAMLWTELSASNHIYKAKSREVTDISTLFRKYA